MTGFSARGAMQHRPNGGGGDNGGEGRICLEFHIFVNV